MGTLIFCGRRRSELQIFGDIFGFLKCIDATSGAPIDDFQQIRDLAMSLLLCGLQFKSNFDNISYGLKTKIRGFSRQENHTDRVTAACRRS
jgi:hypothetical protein